MPNVKVKVIVEVDGQRVGKETVSRDIRSRAQATSLADAAKDLVNQHYHTLTGRYGL